MSDPSKKKVGLPPKKRMRHDRHFVDELAQRMGEGIGRMVRVTTITSNHDQPRTNLGDLSDLISSIQKHGVLEPLLVRRRNGGYELVSGERRFHAAMQLGITELPCIELTVSDQTALEIAAPGNAPGRPRDRRRGGTSIARTGARATGGSKNPAGRGFPGIQQRAYQPLRWLLFTYVFNWLRGLFRILSAGHPGCM